MSSKNDITGDEIVSRGFSAKGRENYDAIFRKQTPDEWIAELVPGAKIIDPDGWRADGKSLNEKINRSEFWYRFNLSTVTDPNFYENISSQC